ncbi:MAG: gamma-glutamyltransferase [Spirochaetales bacterium]|nr:gamma-glutamyltransferase [Spirochaetales bacterium]
MALPVRRLIGILKFAGRGIVAAAALAALAYAFLPKGPRDPMEYEGSAGTAKAGIRGSEFAVVAGTPWAAEAGYRILEAGGNAADAAVATLLALNVTHGEAASFPGIAPLMYFDAATGTAESYIGAGVAPRAATIDAFRKAGFETVPELDIRAQLVPASPDVIVALLSKHGTMNFGELAAPAIRLAREGFPAHRAMVENLDFSLVERVGFSVLMPYNAEVFIRGEWWRPVHPNERMVFPDLADTLEALAAAERAALDSGAAREEALAAVRAYFYEGPIAEAIVALHEKKGGFITREDLAAYRGGWENPVRAEWNGFELHANGAWSQGVMESLILRTLEGIDLAALGHNTPEYIHVVTQAIELAMADRDAYIGDLAFVDVPLEILLSDDYAAGRREAMTPRAFPELPEPGDAGSPSNRAREKHGGKGAAVAERSRADALSRFATALVSRSDFSVGQDTSQLAVLDRAGNLVVMTPSDFPQTPMVPGTGLNLGNRMTQFRLDPEHVGALEPGKRPRVTPHALILTRNGEFFMGLSTPGGDMQAQALAQVLLNVIVFGMDLDEAIAAPRFYSVSAPSSFAPHESYPARLRLESSLHAAAAAGLRALGYETVGDPDWHKDYGAVGAIMSDGSGGFIAAADPREETSALGR